MNNSKIDSLQQFEDQLKTNYVPCPGYVVVKESLGHSIIAEVRALREALFTAEGKLAKEGEVLDLNERILTVAEKTLERAITVEAKLSEYEKGEKKYSTKVGEGCDLTDAEQFELRQRLQVRVNTLEALSKDLGIRLTGFNSWVSNLVGRDNEEERLPAIKKFVEDLIGERDMLKAQFTPNGALARENEKLRRDIAEMTRELDDRSREQGY